MLHRVSGKWLTTDEIRTIHNRPIGTIYRLASVNRWRKLDNRKPALYLADDVDATFTAMRPPAPQSICFDCRYEMHTRCDDLYCDCCAGGD